MEDLTIIIRTIWAIIIIIFIINEILKYRGKKNIKNMTAEEAKKIADKTNYKDINWFLTYIAIEAEKGNYFWYCKTYAYINTIEELRRKRYDLTITEDNFITTIKWE